MTLTRPRVEVAQEYAAQPIVADSATLPAIIIGPAYHIRDYADESTRSAILVGTYGSLSEDSDGDTNGRPLSGSTVFTVAEPLDNAPGALLDGDSVAIYAASPVVEIATGTDGVRSTVAPDENLFSSAGATFVSSGIAAGDRLVLTDDADNTVVKTVLSVVSETALRTTSNLTASEFSGGTATGIAWRTERQVADVRLDPAFYAVSEQQVLIFGGVAVAVDIDGDGTDETLPLVSAQLYQEYRALRQDLADVLSLSTRQEIEDAVGLIDERNPLAVALSVALLNAPNVLIYYFGTTGVGDDELDAHSDAIAAVYTREDLYAIVILSTNATVRDAWIAVVGADAALERSVFRVLICASPSIPVDAEISEPSAGTAEAVGDVTIFGATGANFTTAGVAPGHVVVLLGDSAGSVAVRSTARTINKVLGATHVSLTAALDAENQTHHYYVRAASPPTVGALSAAHLYRKAADNVARLGMTTLPPSPTSFLGQLARLDMAGSTYDGDYLILAVVDDEAAAADRVYGDITYTAVDASALGNLITIRYLEPGTPNLPLSVAVVGRAITVTLASDGTGAHDIAANTATLVAAAVAGNAAAALLVTPSVTGTGSTTQDSFTLGESAGVAMPLEGGVSNGFDVVGPSVGPAVGAPVEGSGTLRQTVVSAIAPVETVARAPYARLLDNTATFLTSTPPVIAGDVIEVPAVSGEYDSDVQEVVVASVSSNNRVVVVSGYELPVDDPLDNSATQAIAEYRIARTLDKAGQVTALVETPESISNNRVVMVFPPEVYLAGVTNARTGSSTAQPSYYVAAAVAALVAALPSQAPMSGRTLAGFTRLVASNFYFTRAQIDTLLAAGFFVLVQSTKTDTPYILRQLTTDVTSVLTAELSILKNFDRVGRALKRVGQKFITGHNIVPETVADVETDTSVVLSTLSRQKLEKIGAPVLSFSAPSAVLDPSAADAIIISADVELPKPLNRITYRLRAS